MALYRSVATIGSWTMGSRVLGFIRDILIADVLGAIVKTEPDWSSLPAETPPRVVGLLIELTIAGGHV